METTKEAVVASVMTRAVAQNIGEEQISLKEPVSDMGVSRQKVEEQELKGHGHLSFTGTL